MFSTARCQRCHGMGLASCQTSCRVLWKQFAGNHCASISLTWAGRPARGQAAGARGSTARCRRRSCAARCRRFAARRCRRSCGACAGEDQPINIH